MAAFAAVLKKVGEKVAQRELNKKSGGKRGGVDTSQYLPDSMGLTGSIPGQEADVGDNSSARRKRSNGKDRG